VVVVDPEATPPPTVTAAAKRALAAGAPGPATTPADPDATPPPAKTVVSTTVPLPAKLSTPVQLGFLGSALVLVIGSIIVMAQAQKKVPPQRPVVPIVSTASQVDFAPAPPPKAMPRPPEPPLPTISIEEPATTATHRHTRRGSAHRSGGTR